MDRVTPNAEDAGPDAQRRGGPTCRPMKGLLYDQTVREFSGRKMAALSDERRAAQQRLCYRTHRLGAQQLIETADGRIPTTGRAQTLCKLSILQNLRGSLPEVIQKPERPLRRTGQCARSLEVAQRDRLAACCFVGGRNCANSCSTEGSRNS